MKNSQRFLDERSRQMQEAAPPIRQIRDGYSVHMPSNPSSASPAFNTQEDGDSSLSVSGGESSKSKLGFEITPKKILFIYEDHRVGENFSWVLSGIGYDVDLIGYSDLADNLGPELLKGIDLVMMDILASGVQAVESFNNLRSVQSNLKIIIVAGSTISEEETYMLNGGAVGCLRKPYTIQQLHEMVSIVLATK